ncbi:MAG: ribbon-helix-helix domain-containing protein [Verrucomicrobia bacterium]|nr:ribbon-helix-helix domain-containing protein [Verrucomicrobiota bacterium]
MKSSPATLRHPVAGESVERLSVSVPGDEKAALEMIAAEKRVSLAWVIREAITRYLVQTGASGRLVTQPKASHGGRSPGNQNS